MHELTDEWLKKTNEGFSKNDIPHQQRPWLAWGEWAKLTGRPIAMNDEDTKRIFYWFEKNTKAGSQQIGPMYTGAYYYDSCFWPIVVPVIYGIVTVNARDSLKTMPSNIANQLWTNRDKLIEYVSVWADCFDYAYGFDDLQKISTYGKFAQELLNSGNQQLNATVALLLERSPNSKSTESARMSTEIFLKAFLASKVELSEKDAKNKIRHDLERVLNRCLAVDANSELKAVIPNLKLFPGIEDRYKGTDKIPKKLWCAYAIAQFVGATVVRSLSGRDVRKTIRID
ncbi:MAG: hypothetical protein FJ266_14190 [Planctomycetes bacterium]|nr:hypothetical protein [Planctomycetota bacterium]